MFSFRWITHRLTDKFWLATLGFILYLIASSNQPIQAETEGIVIDMPLDSPIIHNYSDLIAEAELLVENAIKIHLSQNSELSGVQLVITGNRNGEIIPILTTNVSRTQWQANPQVKAWTQYYHASYTLLQRHDVAQVARVEATSRKSNETMLQIDIDRYLDEGSLTGEAAQEHISNID
jgi:hypothetical protein